MLETVKTAVLEAGKEIMKLYKGEFDIEIKGDNSPVTTADTLANAILISHLKTTGYPILSEEKKDNKSRLDSRYVWIIDPIDGTKDFINKTGEFALMVGLIKDGIPILGVVYAPAKEKLYWAEKGKGSFLEEHEKTKRLQVQESNIILISRNHTTQIELDVIEKLGLSSLPCGSIGVKFGLIAEGKAGSYLNLSNKLKQWDSCAPQLILEEAGGKVTDTLGNPIIYNTKTTSLEDGCIGTNGITHNFILEFLK